MPNTATDSQKSFSGTEFVWAKSGHAGAHQYLLPAAFQALRSAKAKTVLDLGCGNGSCSAELSSNGYSVVGCDSSSSGIAIARDEHPSIDFFEYDISQPFPPGRRGKFDAVIALEVVEHLLQPRCLLSAAFEALRPGGTVVISTPYHGYLKNVALAVTNKFDFHWHPLRDFGHVKFFSQKTLTMLVEECGFQAKSFHRLGRVPSLACSMMIVATKTEH